MANLKRSILGTVILAIVSLGCSENASENQTIRAPREDMRSLAEGNQEFAFDLYRKIAAQEKGNMILSPYSISTALAMAYAGAKGQTADEMRQTLHFNLPDDRLHAAMGSSLQQLQPTGPKAPYELTIANALWGQSGFPLQPEFLALTKSFYSAGYREIDFRSKPRDAADTINHWVEKNTKDRIRKLLDASDITPQTQLVLTNAIYFKGLWEKPFTKTRTEKKDFEVTPGSKIQVPMMHLTSGFEHYDSPEFQLLRLPYQGNRISMVVVLPKVRCGLAEVEKKLTSEKLTSAIASAKQQEVQVALPKFKAKQRIQLAQVLKELGMPTSMSDRADFTGISTDGGLAISRVVHQGEIDVDEEGTVAAAATAVVITRTAIQVPVRFVADHPFFFALQDQQSGTLLFLGRFAGE